MKTKEHLIQDFKDDLQKVLNKHRATISLAFDHKGYYSYPYIALDLDGWKDSISLFESVYDHKMDNLSYEE